jgi:hypothetical protein
LSGGLVQVLAHAGSEGFDDVFYAVDALGYTGDLFVIGFELEGWGKAGCEALLVDLSRQGRAVLEQPKQLLLEAADAKAGVLDLVEVRDQRWPLVRRRLPMRVLLLLMSSIRPAASV